MSTSKLYYIASRYGFIRDAAKGENPFTTDVRYAKVFTSWEDAHDFASKCPATRHHYYVILTAG